MDKLNYDRDRNNNSCINYLSLGTMELGRKGGRMKIGLVDVDGHNFPNYALMKISAYHKAQGDEVEWANPFFEYDKVYKSKIFTFTPDDLSPYNCEVVKGGTGYDIASKLPKEIEEFGEVDYSIYPQYPFSIQFLSRGCIRQCPFCLVREKEGYIHFTPPLISIQKANG